MKVKRGLIIGIETLMTGGAELFAIRLAGEMTSHYRVTLIVIHGNLVDQRMIQRLSKEVHLELLDYQSEPIIRIVDGLARRISPRFSLRTFFVVSSIRRIIEREKPDIIHTNLFRVDLLFVLANKRCQVKHITTVHGDYLTLEHIDQYGIRYKEYNTSTAKRVLKSLDGIAVISDRQLIFLTEEWNLKLDRSKLRKIYNGVSGSGAYSADDLSMRFKKRGFVFGMVARGVPGKGWEPLIRAFLSLNREGTQLLLVGEGPHLDSLQAKYPHDGIFFSGYAVDVHPRIKLFDVGILPSLLASESLPTSIIEYLMASKPVIATDIGEIRKMMTADGEIAGILLALHDGKLNEDDLTNAMARIMDDKCLYERTQAAATRCSEVFEMVRCTESYLRFYKEVSDSSYGQIKQ